MRSLEKEVNEEQHLRNALSKSFCVFAICRTNERTNEWRSQEEEIAHQTCERTEEEEEKSEQRENVNLLEKQQQQKEIKKIRQLFHPTHKKLII